MTKFLLAVLFVFVTMAVLTPTNSEGAHSVGITEDCGPRDEMIEVLLNMYGETPYMRGITMTGELFELYVNEKAGTWTYMHTTPNGLFCMRAVGESFSRVKPEIAGEPT